MKSTRPILVGVDQSVANFRACDYAAELAKATQAPLLLVQVIEPVADVVPANVMLAITELVEDQLSKLAARLRAYANEQPVDYAIGRGDPWIGIEKLASERDAELVVVGTFGRRGVSRALLGSVAEKVVRTSSRPVVTVPAHAFVNRSQAGRKLASVLAQRTIHAPSVVALSRGATPIALEVARKLGAPFDLWLTEPIESSGRELGALGEDGHASFLDSALDVTESVRAVAEKEAFQRLSRELKRLRGTLPPGEVWKRSAILVSEGIASPAAIAAASRAMRTLGADRIIAAAPVISREALETISGQCDEVACVETAIVATRPDCWYRHASLPALRAARAAISAYDPARPSAELAI